MFNRLIPLVQTHEILDFITRETILHINFGRGTINFKEIDIITCFKIDSNIFIIAVLL